MGKVAFLRGFAVWHPYITVPVSWYMNVAKVLCTVLSKKQIPLRGKMYLFHDGGWWSWRILSRSDVTFSMQVDTWASQTSLQHSVLSRLCGKGNAYPGDFSTWYYLPY